MNRKRNKKSTLHHRRRRQLDRQQRLPGSTPVGPGAAPDRTLDDWTDYAAHWQLVVFAVGLAVYLWLFYATPMPSGDVSRFGVALFWVTHPDESVAMWFADGVGRAALFDRSPVVLVAALIVAIGWAIGRLLLKPLHVRERLTALERFVFGTAAGLSVVSLYTLVVGLLGGLRHPLWFYLPGCGLLAWSSWDAVQARRRARGDARVACETADAAPASDDAPVGDDAPATLSRRWLWLVAPLVTVMLLSAMLPPAAFDVCEYHLQAPKEWYQAGRITFLPHNVYANMPLGAEMHALAAMALMPGERSWWYGALAGKLVMFCFSPLTALGLLAAGRRFINDTAGVVAALVYLSTPWVALVSTSGLNEGVLACYLLLATYAVWMWTLRRDGPSATDWGGLALAGFLAGSALACKYTAALLVCLPLAIWVAGWRWRSAARPASVFLLAALLACGPWLAKNAALTGNPTYPLLVRAFGGSTRTTERDEQWRRAHRVPTDDRGRRYSAGQLAGSLADVACRSPWLSPLLLPLAVMGLARKKGSELFFSQRTRGRGWKTVLTPFLQPPAVLLMFGLGVWWLATHRIDRFWTPLLPLAALLAGVGACWLDARWWHTAVLALLVPVVVVNSLVIVSPEGIVDTRLFVALERLRNGQPEHVSPGNPTHRYIDRELPAGSRVLLVGDAQPFDLRTPCLYNTCFDQCHLERLLKGRTRQQRVEALRAERITHIYVHWRELERYRAEGSYGFSDFVRPEVLHEMIEQRLIEPPLELPKTCRGQLFRVRVVD